MTLKTDYFDGATGLNEQMQDVFDEGVAYAVANVAVLSTELIDAASKGLVTFTSTLGVTFEPQSLRLKGLHQATFFNGIYKGLSDEGIFQNEVTLVLNESDQIDLKIDFNFSFYNDPAA